MSTPSAIDHRYHLQQLMDIDIEIEVDMLRSELEMDGASEVEIDRVLLTYIRAASIIIDAATASKGG